MSARLDEIAVALNRLNCLFAGVESQKVIQAYLLLMYMIIEQFSPENK